MKINILSPYLNFETFFVLLLFTLPIAGNAQYNIKENNMWAFGVNTGLDFNSGTPVPISTAQNSGGGSRNSGTEANASVSDADGNLLFYSNGSRVWDRNHNLMPGVVNSLHGLGTNYDYYTRSTTQGALIVPMPDSPHKYYLFSSTDHAVEDPAYNTKLYYSIINMNLNSGLGDVEPGKKWIHLDSAISEKMVAVAGDCNNVWVIVHSTDSNLFKAYEVNASGISAQPVISSVGQTGYSPFQTLYGKIVNAYHSVGQLIASPNGDRLIAAWSLGGNFAALYRFDKSTGLVSNEIVLQNGTFYGCAFSADGKKAYIADNRTVFQYDLSSNSPQNIINSRYEVGQNFNTQLRLAPDGKIYFKPPFDIQGYLGVIENPNLSGSACGYNQRALQISGINGILSIPTEVVKPVQPLNIGTYSHFDTFSCLRPQLTLRAPARKTMYIWDDGSNEPHRTITASGTYWVRSVQDCEVQTDSFFIHQSQDLTSNLGSDTLFCQPVPFKLHADIQDASYGWQDGSTNSFFDVSESGQYWVSIVKANCITSDTINVRYADVSQNLGEDFIFCENDPISITLHAKTDEHIQIRWNDGSGKNVLKVEDTGTYFVTAKDGFCEASDTIKISREVCECTINFPTAFTPNGDGRNDIFKPYFKDDCPMNRYVLSIYNRYGQLVYKNTDPFSGWDGNINGTPAETGVYMFDVTYNAGKKQTEKYIKGDLTLIR